MKRILLILFSVSVLVSCSKVNITKDVKINQVESDYPVILNPGKDGTVYSIFFPLAFKISKRTLNKVRLSKPTYLRFDEFGEWIPTASFLYYSEDNDLIWPKDNDKLRILQFREREWVLYARYCHLSKELYIQEFFASDLKRARSECKDTLHIGSMRQLKQTNPGLLNNLLQGDSIYFSFVAKQKFYHITLPVKIK